MFLFKNLKRKSVNLIYNRLFHEWNRTHNSKWNYHLLYWFYIPLMYYTYSLFTFHFTFNKRVRLLLRSLINSNHFCHSLQFKILFNYINTRSEMELVERNMVHYVERIIRHKAVIRTRQKCEYDESCVEVAWEGCLERMKRRKYLGAISFIWLLGWTIMGLNDE